MMGWRTVEHSPLTQVNRAHIGSQRLVQQAWGPHGSAPCSLHICWFLVGLLIVGVGVSLNLCLLLGHISSSWNALSIFISGFLSCLVLSCLSVLSKKKPRGSRSGN